MEIHLPRGEILRLARALLGIQTDNSLSAAAGEQHVAMCQAAALSVAEDCRWVSAQRRETITLGAQQSRINYPLGTGPGSLLAIAVFDQDRYRPLEARIIPVHADTDQQLAAGGATLAAVLGRPTYFQQRQQIELWPRSDKEYPLRLDYMARMDLPVDASLSVVDAQLIVYKTAETIAAMMADSERATMFAQRYAKRLAMLRAWQATGSRFALDVQADLGEDESNIMSELPNWNRLPTVTPPVP